MHALYRLRLNACIVFEMYCWGMVLSPTFGKDTWLQPLLEGK
jgi:hypothetical protein